MRSLAKIKPPYIDHFKEIVKAKRNVTVRRRLKKLMPQISEHYERFESAVERRQLDVLGKSGSLNVHRSDLATCYSPSTKRLEALKNQIKETQNRRTLTRCPYCGITPPTTYDHYLPQERFPEFVVHPLNLVPCCSVCNQSKGVRWLSGKKRLFVHFYSDPIPEVSFLFARLKTSSKSDAVGITFELRKPHSIKQQTWELLKAHFVALKLIEKYNDQAVDEYTEILGGSVSHCIAGGTNVSGFLDHRALQLETDFGINHWRAVLCKVLASHVEFLDTVAKQTAIEKRRIQLAKLRQL